MVEESEGGSRGKRKADEEASPQEPRKSRRLENLGAEHGQYVPPVRRLRAKDPSKPAADGRDRLSALPEELRAQVVEHLADPHGDPDLGGLASFAATSEKNLNTASTFGVSQISRKLAASIYDAAFSAKLPDSVGPDSPGSDSPEPDSPKSINRDLRPPDYPGLIRNISPILKYIGPKRESDLLDKFEKMDPDDQFSSVGYLLELKASDRRDAVMSEVVDHAVSRLKQSDRPGADALACRAVAVGLANKSLITPAQSVAISDLSKDPATVHSLNSEAEILRDEAKHPDERIRDSLRFLEEFGKFCENTDPDRIDHLYEKGDVFSRRLLSAADNILYAEDEESVIRPLWNITREYYKVAHLMQDRNANFERTAGNEVTNHVDFLSQLTQNDAFAEEDIHYYKREHRDHGASSVSRAADEDRDRQGRSLGFQPGSEAGFRAFFNNYEPNELSGRSEGSLTPRAHGTPLPHADEWHSEPENGLSRSGSEAESLYGFSSHGSDGDSHSSGASEGSSTPRAYGSPLSRNDEWDAESESSSRSSGSEAASWHGLSSHGSGDESHSSGASEGSSTPRAHGSPFFSREDEWDEDMEGGSHRSGSEVPSWRSHPSHRSDTASSDDSFSDRESTPEQTTSVKDRLEFLEGLIQEAKESSPYMRGVILGAAAERADFLGRDLLERLQEARAEEVGKLVKARDEANEGNASASSLSPRSALLARPSGRSDLGRD